MVFLRDEEHLQRWLSAHGYEPGESLSAPKLNELSRLWWWSRLDPGWRPRTTDESQALLDSVDLTGDFWQLANA
jgi:hypothetical protein